jgi:hypothetical protein
VARVILVILFFCSIASADLGINIHGISIHSDKYDINTGKRLENINYGAGINYLFYKNGRNSLGAEAGIFRNSKDDAAEYAGLSYRFRIVSGFALGVGITAFNSSAVNDGKFAVAPLPLLTFRHNAFALNLLYAPRLHNVSRTALYTFYFTYYFR